MTPEKLDRIQRWNMGMHLGERSVILDRDKEDLCVEVRKAWKERDEARGEAEAAIEKWNEVRADQQLQLDRAVNAEEELATIRAWAREAAQLINPYRHFPNARGWLSDGATNLIGRALALGLIEEDWK